MHGYMQVIRWALPRKAADRIQQELNLLQEFLQLFRLSHFQSH